MPHHGQHTSIFSIMHNAYKAIIFSRNSTVEDMGCWLSRMDTIHLTVKDNQYNTVYEAYGILDGGNVEIHRK